VVRRGCVGGRPWEVSARGLPAGDASGWLAGASGLVGRGLA
jgi:hypothetical protein